jgi:hypothetical protein
VLYEVLALLFILLFAMLRFFFLYYGIEGEQGVVAAHLIRIILFLL